MSTLSGSFTIDGTTTTTEPNFCKTYTESGSGTIKPNDGSLSFFPDDDLIPFQLGYEGFGNSTATITGTYSDCPVGAQLPPATSSGVYEWLKIPRDFKTFKQQFFTSPDLLSFTDKYVIKTSDETGSSSLTWEWSFSKAN
jgi:hypothetical protein